MERVKSLAILGGRPSDAVTRGGGKESFLMPRDFPEFAFADPGKFGGAEIGRIEIIINVWLCRNHAALTADELFCMKRCITDSKTKRKEGSGASTRLPQLDSVRAGGAPPPVAPLQGHSLRNLPRDIRSHCGAHHCNNYT